MDAHHYNYKPNNKVEEMNHVLMFVSFWGLLLLMVVGIAKFIKVRNRHKLDLQITKLNYNLKRRRNEV